jgi:heme-degrading monooxygenase HmoA
MLRQVFRSLGVSLVVAFVWLGLTASPAQADKVIKSMVFAEESDRIEVLTLYETPAMTQKLIAKSLKITNKPMKKAMGFQGLATLQSQDGTQLASFSQWDDLESYQAYAESLTTTYDKAYSKPQSSGYGGSSSYTPPEPTQTLVLKIIDAQTSVEGATPAIRGREPVVQLVQFTAKTPDAQPQILERLQALIPDLLQQQPIPQSILLLKNPEVGGDYSLLRIWNCSALFEDVGQPTEIALEEDLLALTESEQHLYDIFTILPAPPKKAKDKDYSYY